MAFAPVDEQLALIRRGAVDLVVESELRARLARGKPLTVKVGFDPTAPDIHLGHCVLLRKMRHFQDLGHRVIFVIGDFTGMIGDPTGRSATRPPLTREQILDNAETYKRQCFKVLDPEATEIRFNSEWLGELGAEGLVRLAARYNVARMLERNDFKKRYQAGQSIAMHEFLYPLAQAFDSVALEADVELGGSDQLFNLNVGRDIMPGYDLPPQVVLTTPLLEGLDGVEKMSKSLDNYIGIDEPAEQIFGKVMSISDELMWRYYELCTDEPLETIERDRKRAASGELHPKAAKQRLARLIIEQFHDAESAARAQAEFDKVFTSRGVPSDVPEFAGSATDGALFLPALLADSGLAKSRSEANRLLKAGALSIDGEKVAPGEMQHPVEPGQELLLKLGKRRFLRVHVK